VQHFAFRGPKAEIEIDRTGFDTMNFQPDGRSAAGGNLDRPLLLRTGAAQLASAFFAVESDQTDRFAAGVRDGNFDEVIRIDGKRADVHRRFDLQDRNRRPVGPPEPGAREEADGGDGEQDTGQRRCKSRRHGMPQYVGEAARFAAWRNAEAGRFGYENSTALVGRRND
jgi:hypothetical protein